MTRERLTKDYIKQDLWKVLQCRESNGSDWRMSYIVPVTLLSAIIGFIFKWVWIALVFFGFAAYHIVRLIIETRNNNQSQKLLAQAMERGAFSVSIEKLSHIKEETIYEPHFSHRRDHATKDVSFFYFDSGVRWRVPSVRKHYEWSKLYYMSSEGLKHTSVVDNEFYVIKLQGDHEIAYIYNMKLFDLDFQEDVDPSASV